jgi:trans-aconitate methyltransferase
MIGQARQNYPGIQFVLQDAAQMTFDREFDAVFSNAALHWMLQAEAVAQAIATSLKMGARFIAELGANGNIAAIENAIRSVLRRHSPSADLESRTWFPSLGEYSTLLERHGLEVRGARLFDRPTPLSGEDGMLNWLEQFASYHFQVLPGELRTTAMKETVELLRPKLFSAGGWFADYRRLRITACRAA